MIEGVDEEYLWSPIIFVTFDYMVKKLSHYTVTSKTESMFGFVSLYAPYVESKWTKFKWTNMDIVVSFVYYNPQKIQSKKQLRFGSKWIPKLTTL